MFQGVNLANLINKQIASQRLKNILGAHGAVELDVPLMLPKLSIYESCSQLVTFMDSAGNLVSLPFDLRVSCYFILVASMLLNYRLCNS